MGTDLFFQVSCANQARLAEKGVCECLHDNLRTRQSAIAPDIVTFDKGTTDHRATDGSSHPTNSHEAKR
jgi:hypothetical protein